METYADKHNVMQDLMETHLNKINREIYSFVQ